MQITNATASAAHRLATLRKRSFLRGLCAGVITKLLFLALIVLGEYFLRPFVWSALSDLPYDTDPIDPNSREWVFLQLLGFVASFVSGAAVMRWSNRGSWAALATYAAIALALVTVTPQPATGSLVRLLVWFLEAPAGVLLGGLTYAGYEARQGHDA